MNVNSENARGLLGTILFHLLVALGLFLWKLDTSASEPEYVEVSLASLSKNITVTPVHPVAKGSGNAVSTPFTAKSKSLNLPERRFAAGDEVIHVPASTKMRADDQSARMKGHIAENSVVRKERGVGLGTGSKARLPLPGIDDGVAGPEPPMTAGSSVGKNVSVSMQWGEGGVRKKISGALPEYPAGVKVEALIRIEIVVLPDGSVKSLRPAQKGNMRLEEAAMRETRLWMFEPLSKSTPQRDQTCLVTFNFRLR